MKRIRVTKNEALAAVSIIVGITSTVAGLSATAASADTSSAALQSSSSIAQSVIRADRLDTMAKVLNMTTAQVQAHLKAHDLKQVLASKGLSMQASRQSVLAQLKSELQAQGYSQTQIDSALQAYQQRYAGHNQ